MASPDFQQEMCNFAKAGSPFVSGSMSGDTCVLTNKGPPGPPGGGAPPGGAPLRRKREAGKRVKRDGPPQVNLDTFPNDFVGFFAVQDKPVRVGDDSIACSRATLYWTWLMMASTSTHSFLPLEQTRVCVLC